MRGRVDYFVFDDNPHRKVAPGRPGPRDFHFTNADGTFRLVIHPGPGVLAAYVFGPYVRATGVAAIYQRRKDWLSHIRRGLRFPEQFHAFQWIEPAPGDSFVIQNLVVEPGDRRP